MRILQLARQYQIVPLGLDQWSRFPFEMIEDRLVNLRNHILFDRLLPRIVWPVIRYVESPTENAVTQWLRPVELSRRQIESGRSHRLRPSTRIRTWAIYFLTRRGGGSCTEQQAIDLWNSRSKESLVSRNFRKDRERLLANPSHSAKSG